MNDLNINNPAGARILIDRIRNASIQACSTGLDRRSPQSRADFEQCRMAALERIVRMLDVPVLTSLASRATLPPG